MTNAFEAAREVEYQANKRLEPFLRMKAEEGRYVVVNKGPLARQMQEMVGDFVMNISGEGIMSVELKAEQRKTNNFFIEEWSNYPETEDVVPNPGWARKTNATFIAFYFLDTDDLYIFKRINLQWWLYGTRVPSPRMGLSDEIAGGALYDPKYKAQIKQVMQKAYKQKNRTTGFLVPISLATSCVQHRHFKVADEIARMAA